MPVQGKKPVAWNEVSVGGGSLRPHAQQALGARLFERDGGLLRNVLKNFTRQIPSAKCAITIATDPHVGPIGVCTIEDDGRVNVYVKPRYRKHSIGRRLVAAAIAIGGRTRNTVYASSGLDEAKSMAFWRGLGIFIDRCEGIPLSNGDLTAHSIRQLIIDQLRHDLKEQGFDEHHYLWNYYDSVNPKYFQIHNTV